MIRIAGGKLIINTEDYPPAYILDGLNQQLKALGLYPKYKIRLVNGMTQIGFKSGKYVYRWTALYGEKVLPYIPPRGEQLEQSTDPAPATRPYRKREPENFPRRLDDRI
jgi:hypothetical protein